MPIRLFQHSKTSFIPEASLVRGIAVSSKPDSSNDNINLF